MTPDASPPPSWPPQPTWPPQYAPAAPPAPLPVPQRRSRRRTALIVAAATIVMVAVGALGIVSSIQERRDPHSARNVRALISACHERVAARLRSPMSARWAGDDAAGTDESGVWHVVGVVHAANGFGVLLPHRYQCAADWRRDHTWLVYDATVTAG